MATDDLTNDDDKGTEEGANKSPAPLSSADITTAVKAGLGDLSGDMRAMGTQITQAVSQVIQQSQKAVEDGVANKSQSDLTQQLLSEPEKAINGLLQKWAQENLGPYFATQVQDGYETLLDTQRAKVDREYGEGTFDELVLPELEAVVEATPNKASKASKKYISTVVQGILGNDKVRPKLMDKYTTKQTADKAAAAENDGPNGILDGGRRRTNKSALSSEDIAFLASRAEETGEKIDHKLMGDILAVRKRDGAWTLDNFPGLDKKSA